MSNFDLAVHVVLEHEGSWCVDSGGPTNWGVTLPVLKAEGRAGDIDYDGDIDADDIRKMTDKQAICIYRRQWWNRYSYGLIFDQAVATKVFDLAVNMGPRQAHLILQRALRAVGGPVEEDGILGAQTLRATNDADPARLTCALRSEAAGVYRLMLAKHPDYKPYATGWLRRAYD